MNEKLLNQLFDETFSLHGFVTLILFMLTIAFGIEMYRTAKDADIMRDYIYVLEQNVDGTTFVDVVSETDECQQYADIRFR